METFDFAILVVDDLLAAGKKRVAGKNVASEERFLIVAGDRIFHPTVLAAFEIAQAQARLRLVTRDVKNLLAVRREHWTKRALDLVNKVVFVASFAVAPGDVPSGKLLVVIQRAELRRIVKILSVRGSHHTHSIRAPVPFQGRSGLGFGDLHARAAVHVVHPNFAGADAELGF